MSKLHGILHRKIFLVYISCQVDHSSVSGDVCLVDYIHKINNYFTFSATQSLLKNISISVSPTLVNDCRKACSIPSPTITTSINPYHKVSSENPPSPLKTNHNTAVNANGYHTFVLYLWGKLLPCFMDNGGRGGAFVDGDIILIQNYKLIFLTTRENQVDW